MKKAFMFVVLITFTLITAAFAGPPSVVWNNTYESGGNDWPFGLTTDASGNVYVTGYYGDLGTAAACRTIKYDTDGNVLWNKLHDDAVIEVGMDVAVDPAGNVYVVGWIANADWDYLILKYNASGDLQWVETWDGIGHDLAMGVATDASGNVYVTGASTNGANNDFRTIKYDTDANLQWGQSYNEAGDNDNGYGVAVDGAGYVYVTGSTFNGPNENFLTLKYDKDGNLEWSDVRDEIAFDQAHAIAVDQTGVYVTGGSSNSSGDIDFFTVKYDKDGTFQWKERSGDSHDNAAWDIAVDDRFVYLTGYSDNGVDFDFLTVRYDKEGNLGWEKIFDSGDNDWAYGIGVDQAKHVYVAGYYNDGADYDFRTIKYQQDDVAVAENPSESVLILEVTGDFSTAPTLRYEIPAGTQGTLTFYSADGRKLETYTLDPANSTFVWSKDVPHGVYFARLQAGNLSATTGICLTK